MKRAMGLLGTGVAFVLLLSSAALSDGSYPLLEESILRGLSVRALDDGQFELQIRTCPDAAGFWFDVLVDTETSGAAALGDELGLGPHARSLGIGKELDSKGEYRLIIACPGSSDTHYFQLVVATSVLEYIGGSFWRSEVVHCLHPELGDVLFYDDFNYPLSGWPTDTRTDEGRGYQGGEYAIWIAQAHDTFQAWAPTGDPISGSFVIDLSAYVAEQATSTLWNTSYGIVWGRDNGNLYMLLVDPNGRYTVTHTAGWEPQEDPLPLTSTGDVRGSDELVRLRLIVRAEEATIERDGTTLATFALTMDGPYYVGAAAGTRQCEYIEARFTKFAVYALEDEEPLEEAPADETPIAGSGVDQPVGGLGTDYMFGCVPDSSVVIEDCFDLQLSPAGLITGSESVLDIAFVGDGFAVVSPSAEPHDGETGYVAYLPVDLPLRPCCEELELTGLAFCYQSLTREDTIELVQIGYLNDAGMFEEIAAVEGDLSSLSWDCAFFPFSDVFVFRPLVFRIWFGFGGAPRLAAAAGVRFGNIRAVLAPRRKPATWAGHESRPGNITCAKLLTCFPWCGGEWSCSDGADYRDCRPPLGVRFYLRSDCEEAITCKGVTVLDETGEVVWIGGSVFQVEPVLDHRYYHWDDLYHPLADCPLPAEGDYEVVLQTNLGEFRKKFSVWRDGRPPAEANDGGA